MTVTREDLETMENWHTTLVDTEYTYTSVLVVTCGVQLVLTMMRCRNPAVQKFFVPALLFAIANGILCTYYYF